MLFKDNILQLFTQNFGLIIFFGLFLGFYKYVIQVYIKRLKLPPGPIGVPIVGHSLFLGEFPHKYVKKMSEKYGSVFTLQLSVTNVVMVNDWQATKEVLSKDEFLGRPQSSLNSGLGRPKSMVEISGGVWRDHKRVSLHLLRDLGFGKDDMEDKIISEIKYLFETIDKNNGKDIDINRVLTPSMSNNICNLMFGHRYETDDPDRVALDEFLGTSSPLFSQTRWTWMAPQWVTTLYAMFSFMKNKDKFIKSFKIIDDEFSKHLENFDENNIRDYMDGYLAEVKKRQANGKDTSFTNASVIANASAFFGAGSATVRTTSEWLLIMSAKYPEHQKRIQREIDDIIGRERCPTYADRTRMPFTQAFINEVFRYKPTVPFNLLRRTLDDVKLQGHLIPRDTLVLINIWAVHNDPKIWNEPDQFKPDRFLDSNGKLTKTESLIPFSMGKRNCAGESMGRNEVFLYFTSLLQRYSITPSKGHNLSLEEQYGIELRPKYSAHLDFNLRQKSL